MRTIKILFFLLIAVLIISTAFFIFFSIKKNYYENKVLKEVIERLQADTRIAEVLVTGVNYDEKTKRTYTTIKFLEYDTEGRPLEPRYFTFPGNIIQFQSLVVRFDDIYIRSGDKLRGKSAYLFWKVFMLDGANTQEYYLTRVHDIPQGYKLYKLKNSFEKKLWERFWDLAVAPQEAKRLGIKNIQIEAPGTIFIPGMLYTVKIEHDGGMKIDTIRLSPILKGERIPE